MPRLASLIVALLFALLPSATLAGEFHAEAKFVEGQNFTLPDGRPGELRQVRDMGFLPGPDALLVLDAEGRLLAKSPSAQAMTILCEGQPRTCHGFDHDRRTLLLLDQPHFKSDGAVVPPLGETDKRAVGRFGPGPTHWGFIVRKATLAELAGAEWAHARQHRDVHVSAFIGGALLALLLTVWIGLPRKRSWQRLTLWALVTLVRLAAAGYILMILLTMLILGGYSALSLMSLFTLGIGLVLAPLLFLHLRRRRAAPA